jgi:hypothetical protein
MEEIRKFLSEHEEHQDEFWESDALIWVDWRDFDESIIEYFNKKLPDEDKIQFECVETEKERGVDSFVAYWNLNDIFMKKNGVSAPIPYADDCTDRDTTLRSIQEYLSPQYQLRWYMGSLGSDTLAFCIYPTSEWEQIEQEFGTEKVSYYFAPVQANSVMFEMDMNEVFALLEQRGDA